MGSWPEDKPLSEENLSDLQDQIDQANANVLAAKTPIAAAITTMGQSASDSDSWLVLEGKIKDISDDADAAVGDVDIGKTFYQGGLKRVGTKPQRTGHVTGQSVSRSGTTIRIRPQPGNYPGDANNSVQITDADFVASNIKKDVDIFGLTGTFGIHRVTGKVSVLKDKTFLGPNGGGFTDKECNFIQIPKPAGFTSVIELHATLDVGDVSNMYRSTSIAGSSGSTVLNKPVTSISGAVLIYTQSDSNYIYVPLYNGEWSLMDGKEANYTLDWM